MPAKDHGARLEEVPLLGQSFIANRRHALEVRAARAQLRFVNGLSLLLTDEFQQVGPTPRREILAHPKGTILSRYVRDGGAKTAGRTPVLLVPPLMVRPYIYDLRNGASLAQTLMNAGLDTYLVDFGVPDEDDREVRLDDYVLDYLPACIEAARKESGSDDVFLLGWCKGGIFAALYAAAFAPAPVRGIVSIAAPIDMKKLGLLWWTARAAQKQVPSITQRMGNVPGVLSSTAFKLMNPLRTVTQYADLWANLWNAEYIEGHEAMRKFLGDFIPYPQAAFEQLVTQLVAENSLVEGKLEMGGRAIDLAKVHAPLLCIAGDDDQVTTKGSAKALVSLVGSKDKEFMVIPGGHIGVLVGGNTRENVWPKITEWLVQRSQS
jgi:polyhydroxyalkanoate synthase